MRMSPTAASHSFLETLFLILLSTGVIKDLIFIFPLKFLFLLVVLYLDTWTFLLLNANILL